MLTGVYTHKHKMIRNIDTQVSPYIPAMEPFNKSGYSLGHFGKNHSGMDLSKAGFDG
jgi:arylsulfatase A-like enzyme